MLMGLACVAQNAVAQNLETTAQQARTALEGFLVAWNSGSIANVRQVLNYPHITHSPSGLIIAETPEQAAKDSDFVFSCVGNDDDLREVAIGKKGIFNTIKKVLFILITQLHQQLLQEKFMIMQKKMVLDF